MISTTWPLQTAAAGLDAGLCGCEQAVPPREARKTAGGLAGTTASQGPVQVRRFKT